jgi:hypothetical protein
MNRLSEILNLQERLAKLNAKFPDNRRYANALVSLRQAAHQYECGKMIVAHRAARLALMALEKNRVAESQ